MRVTLVNLALYKRSFKKILLFFIFWCESDKHTLLDDTLMAVMKCVCNGAMQTMGRVDAQASSLMFPLHSLTWK